MGVFLERPVLNTVDQIFSSPEGNHLRYEIDYQSFLNWWRNNQERFNSLSFRIDNQVNLFSEQLKKGGIATALDQLRMDIYGYYLEYIRQEGIIPFSLKINSSGQVVGEFYGDKTIVEVVDPKERGGAVLEAMIDLQERLKNLDKNEVIFRISPSGWTGLGYEYTETQTQVLWRDKDKFRGLTIRTQIELKQILSLISSLGVEIPQHLNDQKEIIKWITSLNITLPYPIEEFIQWLMEAVNNQDHQGRDLKRQMNNWLEKDSDFRRFDDIASLVNFLEARIKNLVNRSNSLEEIREKLPSLISFVLMAMAGDFQREKGDYDQGQIIIDSSTRFLPTANYDKVFNYLQSLPGCAGGGNVSGDFVLTSFGTRAVVENDKYGSREFDCPHCGEKVLRPKDVLLEKCPHCGGDVRC